MFCKNCGKQLKDGQMFCPACGTKTIAQQVKKSGYSENGNPTSGMAEQIGRTTAGAVQGGMRAGAGAVKGIAAGKLIAAGIAVLLALIVLVYMMFFRTNKPEDTIADLEKGLNNLDQEAVLDCFDSQVNAMYDSMLSIGGELTGMDLEGMADIAGGLGGVMSESGMAPDVTLEVLDVTYTEKEKCKVTVHMSASYEGEVESDEETFTMIIEDRKWRITIPLDELY